MILLGLLSSLKYILPFNLVNWMETVDTFLDANNVPHSELFPLSMAVDWALVNSHLFFPLVTGLSQGVVKKVRMMDMKVLPKLHLDFLYCLV